MELPTYFRGGHPTSARVFARSTWGAVPHPNFVEVFQSPLAHGTFWNGRVQEW